MYGTVYYGQIKVNPDNGSPVTTNRSDPVEPASPLMRLGVWKNSSNVDVAIKVVSIDTSEKKSSSQEKLEEKEKEKEQKCEKDQRRAKQR